MNVYNIPHIHPFYYIHTVSYYGGFPEGRAMKASEEDVDRYIFFFEDVYKKRVMVTRVRPETVHTKAAMESYVNNIEIDGFLLVGVRLPYTNHIITARDIL